ncbi:MAG: FAD-binding oxidoreductase [Acidobacteria bacterium]|nr:FAD-binding oxidoreductase [Acidobacteriota bacterium]
MFSAFRTAVADPAQVSTRAIDRHANAHDASHFLLTPQVVITARDAEEVGRLFAASTLNGVSLTFRSGGTSLSGQAVTDAALVDVRQHFKGIEVLDDGARVRVQPGVTVRALNARLAGYGRKFGPDPASEIACTVGGVVANNSSGMECGITDNAYQTLESLVAVLPSGTVVDTGAPDADAQLRAQEPELHDGLLELAQRVRSSAAATAKIQAQYAMKNTMGYGLNSLLDFDSASQILAHLLVGSEGTLGFVASATFRTVEKRSQISSGLVVFRDLASANAVLPEIVASGAATVELMDSASLRVGQTLPNTPAAVANLSVANHAALLIEYHSNSAEDLAQQRQQGLAVLAKAGTEPGLAFQSDPALRSQLWTLRKGLYATIAGARPSGTTALLEDIVVPVPELGTTCAALGTLFDKYSYANSVIFGHAKDGNIHFMLTDGFATTAELNRYSAFTEDMVDLVLGAGGSLKAEHGTGRVMAPFVRRQFGDELYGVMRRIKELFDPSGVLNPGVLLDDDPTAHLNHIKTAPPVAEEVDRCVSCGYCEPVCPSRDLTLTPRQRIVTLRSIEAAKMAGDGALVAELERDYEYAGVQTCAVDGMCQTACPVGINTGTLVKTLRQESAPKIAQAGWAMAADHWAGTTRAAGLALSAAPHIPLPLISGVNKAARSLLGADTVPLYSPELPAGGSKRRRPAPTQKPEAVYFPSCTATMFGPTDASTSGVQVSFEELCAAAGISVLIPATIDSLCCGTPWSSKGMKSGLERMQQRTVTALIEASDGGRLPIICDASSCTEGIRHALENHAAQGNSTLRVIDAVEFAAERLLPLLPQLRKLPSLTMHPTCSSVRMGLDSSLNHVAAAVADVVHVPENWGCCAFAGERGMLHPELTAAATAPEAADVVELNAAAHASCNRTCELGMTRATGQEYRHILELLADSARPRTDGGS